MDMEVDMEIRERSRMACGRARGGRPSQQDDLICLHDRREDVRLMVLADGMGGDGAGELAAGGVIHAARELWDARAWEEQPGALFLETLCQQAHAEIRRRNGWVSGEPHSTVVALLTRGEHAYWAHVGDSRLYHFQGRRCLVCTRDHSLARLKVDRGELSMEELASDPEQHVLLRGLGGERPPEVEHGYARLKPGQGFVLCSDGIWERVSERELADLLREEDLLDAVHSALVRACKRGGETGDNVAMIVTRTPRVPVLRRWLGGGRLPEWRT
jgi:serine/threonine protein phosphatase PrpC